MNMGLTYIRKAIGLFSFIKLKNNSKKNGEILMNIRGMSAKYTIRSQVEILLQNYIFCEWFLLSPQTSKDTKKL
jgi:hypothetical protein